MLRFAHKGTLKYLESGPLSALDFLTHAFCTRIGGVSRSPYDSLNVGDLVGDREEDFMRNLNLLRESFNIPTEGLILMMQVHGDMILSIDGGGPLPGGLPKCDGLITDRKGAALGVRTADCVPLLFADRIRRIVGAAHAGWRGTAVGISSRMITAFRERFASRPEDIMVAIGPAIGPCCYEVDAPVLAAFSAMTDAALFSSPSRREGRRMVDLAQANRLQLLAAGVPSGNISVSSLCTGCHRDLFFSHRAEGGCTGRQIGFIMLR